VNLKAPTAALFALAALGCGEPTRSAGAYHGLQNVIRWTTASEVDNYGFDIYRSTSEDGHFEIINDSTVAGAGTSDVPQDYEYFDTSIEPGVAYYYYVESVSMTGVRARATPTIHARPRGSNAPRAGSSEFLGRP